MPAFARGYMGHGAGNQNRLRKNEAAFDGIDLPSAYLSEPHTPETEVTVGGVRYAQPFGVAPIGLGGIIWPGADAAIARAVSAACLPMTLSAVGSLSIEDAAEICGRRLWFQLYNLSSRDVRDDLLARADAAGVRELVLTIDVPSPSRREAALSAGLPPGGDVSLVSALQASVKPAYALNVLRHGVPGFATLARYAPSGSKDVAGFVRRLLSARVGPEDIKAIRARWPHRLVVKGVLSVEDAKRALDLGADALWLSNHGGRQSDALSSPIDQLPSIRDCVSDDVSVFIDSGVRSGLDVLRALSLGASMAFLGRPFYASVAAMGSAGPKHAIDILSGELRHSMIQHAGVWSPPCVGLTALAAESPTATKTGGAA